MRGLTNVQHMVRNSPKRVMQQNRIPKAVCCPRTLVLSAQRVSCGFGWLQVVVRAKERHLLRLAEEQHQAPIRRFDGPVVNGSFFCV